MSMRIDLEVLNSVDHIITTSTSDSECVSENVNSIVIVSDMSVIDLPIIGWIEGVSAQEVGEFGRRETPAHGLDCAAKYRNVRDAAAHHLLQCASDIRDHRLPISTDSETVKADTKSREGLQLAE